MDKVVKYQGLIAPCGMNCGICIGHMRKKKPDKRYRTNYHMSMIENLDIINNKGLEVFLTMEESRWKCLSCGSGISVHRDFCIYCNTEFKNKKQ